MKKFFIIAMMFGSMCLSQDVIADAPKYQTIFHVSSYDANRIETVYDSYAYGGVSLPSNSPWMCVHKSIYNFGFQQTAGFYCSASSAAISISAICSQNREDADHATVSVMANNTVATQLFVNCLTTRR